MSPDSLITAVTHAPTHDAAMTFMRTVRSRALLLAACDQLHIDGESRGSATLRRLIVEEARA